MCADRQGDGIAITRDQIIVWTRWPGGHDVLDYGYVHVKSASVHCCVSVSAFSVSQLFVLAVWRVEEDVVDLYYLRLVGTCLISIGTGRVTVGIEVY